MYILKLILWQLLSFFSEPLFFGPIPFKLSKRNWYFKKGDSDINPSFPHLHCKNSKLKMNIYNGIIYDGKTAVSMLSDKDFINLWSSNKFLQNVKEIRKLYPYGIEKLPPIPDVSDVDKLCRNSHFE